MRAWHLYLLAGVLATGGYFLLPSTAAQNVLNVLLGASAVVAIVVGIFLHRPSHPLPWCLFASGMALFVAGDVTWAVYEIPPGIESPYPSVAEVFYSAGVPAMIAGGLLLGRGGIGRNGTGLIDPLIVATGVGTLLWVLLAQPPSHDSTLLERLLSTIYLTIYVLAVTILVRPLLILEKRLPALYLICGGVAVLIVVDVGSGSTASGTYETGGPSAAGWLLFYVLLATAALHPSMAALSEPAAAVSTKLTWGRLVLFTGAMLMPPGVVAIQAALYEAVNVLVVVAVSVVLFLLVAARMAAMVSERMALERQLEFRAFHDHLTGLPNRALFEDRLEQALARAERHEGKVALLFMDLDDFKPVNDSLGHQAGDQLLVEAAGRLRACLRPADTPARLGGDEFAILLEDVEGEQQAVRVARRILEALRAPIALGEREAVVGASVGIAFGAAQDLPRDLLRKADLALYRAKDKGKDSYEVFT